MAEPACGCCSGTNIRGLKFAHGGSGGGDIPNKAQFKVAAAVTESVEIVIFYFTYFYTIRSLISPLTHAFIIHRGFHTTEK